MAKVKTPAAPAPESSFSLIKQLMDKHKCLMPMGSVDLNVRKVPTGIWTLDETLSGGIPLAKITEIHGSGGAGKTSLACLIGASFQRAYPEKIVVYIDTESALDEHLAMTIYGLNPKRTVLARPDANFTAEKLMDALLDAAHDSNVSLVILDSVAGMVTAAEGVRDSGEVLVAPLASLLGRTLKKLNNRPDPEAATVLLLNQQRHGIGPNAGITCPGGSAVEFYPSLRIRLKRGDYVKAGEQEIGFTCRATVTKARYSRNRVVTGWSVIYGDEGISTLRAIVTVATEQGLVVKNGAWFNIVGVDRKWHGMENMLEALRTDDSLFSFLRDNLQVQYTTEAV